MLSVEDLMNKYGFALPPGSTRFLLRDYLEPHQPLLNTELRIRKNLTRTLKLPWEADRDILKNTGNDKFLTMFGYLQNFERRKDIKARLLRPVQFGLSTNKLVDEMVLDEDAWVTLDGNYYHVNCQELRSYRPQIRNLLNDTLGDFTWEGPKVLLECGRINQDRQNYQRLSKQFAHAPWVSAFCGYALWRSIEALGDKPEQEELSEEYVIVSESFAKTINTTLTLPYREIPQCLDESVLEIYQSLKQEMITQNEFDVTCNSFSTILERAIALK